MRDFLNITEPFTEKYTVIIDSEVKAVNINIQNRSRMRWHFSVLNIAGDQIEVELIKIDNVLINTNSPITNEVQQVSNIFSNMYNEIRVVLDAKGNVIKLLNLDVIRDKWNTIKAEMEKHLKASPDLEQAIILNDALFQNPDNILKAVSANEILSLLFNHSYGYSFPYYGKSFKGFNYLNTAEVKWIYDGKKLNDTRSTVEYEINSVPEYGLFNNFNAKAYKQFENQLNINKLKPEMGEKGQYLIEKNTGRLIEANVHRFEIAEPDNLFIKLDYTLMSDEVFRKKLSEQPKRYAPAEAV